MSTGWHSPTADRETTYRDWYEWAWQATDHNRRRAIEVANAALAASDRGADLARIIAAANSALIAETPLDPPASTATRAPTDDRGWSMRDFGLLISAAVLALIAVIQIVSIAGTAGSQHRGSLAAAKTTTQQSNAALDAAGAYKAAADDAASANAAAEKAANIGAGVKGAATKSAYSALLVTDLHRLSTAARLLGASCVAVEIGGCRTAVQNVHDKSAGFLRDLNAVAVPPDYATADGLLRQALNQYTLGAALQVKGIDDLNPTEMNAGSAMVTNGTSLIEQATESLPAH